MHTLTRCTAAWPRLGSCLRARSSIHHRQRQHETRHRKSGAKAAVGAALAWQSHQQRSAAQPAAARAIRGTTTHCPAALKHSCGNCPSVMPPPLVASAAASAALACTAAACHPPFRDSHASHFFLPRKSSSPGLAAGGCGGGEGVAGAVGARVHLTGTPGASWRCAALWAHSRPHCRVCRTTLCTMHTCVVVAHGRLLEQPIQLKHLVVVGALHRLDALRGGVEIVLPTMHARGAAACACTHACMRARGCCRRHVGGAGACLCRLLPLAAACTHLEAHVGNGGAAVAGANRRGNRQQKRVCWRLGGAVVPRDALESTASPHQSRFGGCSGWWSRCEQQITARRSASVRKCVSV
jgi:hypothetical protein